MSSELNEAWKQGTSLYFEWLKGVREPVESFESLFYKILDKYLESQNDDVLNVLLKLINDNKEHPAFDLIANLNRMQRLVRVIELEKQNGFEAFCYGCSSTDQLIEKYERTVFSLLRIESELSQEFVEEGIEYIVSNNISPILINVIFDYDAVIFRRKACNRLSVAHRKLGNLKLAEGFENTKGGLLS